MLNKNIENFIGCDSGYDESKAVIFGAPFDSTTSFRPGARFASKAIRGDSFGIESYSVYQDKDLCDFDVFDAGDLELSIGNTESAIETIEETTAKIINDGKVPVMIGGEHLVTFGAVKAVARKYPDLNIIHFDAHADLRDDYLGVKLSHACVMRRCWEVTGDGRIFQFGIRSGDRSEFEWAKDHVKMRKFDFYGLDDIVEKLGDRPVYFSLDLDVLDPSVFPGTGTPEPGGVMFKELLSAIYMLSDANVVACDVNELSPVYDQSGASTAVACKVIRELLLTILK